MENRQESFFKPLNRSSSRKRKVYEYEVEAAESYTPVGIDTFRATNPLGEVHKPDSLRGYDHFTPKKVPKRARTNTSYYDRYSNQSSGRKTVRFAETDEGLLKSVAVDPTFNESEYLYDMQVNF